MTEDEQRNIDEMARHLERVNPSKQTESSVEALEATMSDKQVLCGGCDSRDLKLIAAQTVVHDAQKILARYIVPDSRLSEHDAINELLGLLDGPRGLAATEQVRNRTKQSDQTPPDSDQTPSDYSRTYPSTD